MKRMDFSIGVVTGIIGYIAVNKVLENKLDIEWNHRAKLFNSINNIKNKLR